MSDDQRRKIGDSDDVVDEMLDDLGVDEEMKQELIESGRISVDVFRVASADQVRRRIEIEKSMDRFRDNLKKVERNLNRVDNSIDRIERDLIPVVLSFLVGLKGDLVNLRGTIIGRSKRRAKTNLQAEYVESEVKSIVEDEFSEVEETLTSGMSTPVLGKVRNLTDSLQTTMKTTYEEFSDLKSSIDDYVQKTSTELEFLSKELTMKPEATVPKEVKNEMKQLQARVDSLEREIGVAREKLQNREAEIETLKDRLQSAIETKENLENRIAKMEASPSAEAEVVADLRQNVKSLEASKDVVERKLEESRQQNEELAAQNSEYKNKLVERKLEIEELNTKINQLNDTIEQMKEKTETVDDLRARLRSFESGDKARELERTRSELERVSANFDRLSKDHEATKDQLAVTTQRLEGYLGLMNRTEKTKAFLMVEEHGEMSLREIARSLGVAPAIVRQWAEEFEDMEIARIVDDQKLVLGEKMQEPVENS
ncbi:MAG: hypothetical protein KGY80_12245 [Candidatus Thorarchaeota archaeon]|nr:hypothetical protein [Candidatus Thorarchaeota archaeon]